MSDAEPVAPRVAGLGARAGTWIAASFLSASALGFVLLGVLARWLDQDQNARFLALWGLVFGIGSALSAVEQEIVRLATNAHIDGKAVAARAWQVTAVAIVVAMVVIAAIIALPGIGAVLRDAIVICVLVFVAAGGFAVQCLSRAVLLGTNRVGAYGSVVVLEAVLRLALSALLILTGVRPTLELATLVIVIGCFGWLPVARTVARSLSWTAERSSLRSVGSTVGALGLANGLQSLQITAFPAVAAAILGTSAAMAPVFGAVTLARLPLIVLAPVQAMAVPVATRMIRLGRRRELRSLVVRLSLAGLAASAAALVVGWSLGPWALRLYMGRDYVIAPAVIAVFLAASCVLAVALLEVAALIALERYWHAVQVWLLSAATLALTLASGALPADQRAAAAVMVGALTSWATATLMIMRTTRDRQQIQ